MSNWIFEFDFSNYLIIKYVGFALVTSGFVLGILALITMKNSWRVGIKYGQKTDLVTTGIYRFSRNPYFFSYDILILGYILIFPSIILIILYLALVFVFHNMILEEEKYLQSVHGDSYLDYKRKVNRYLTIKL
jgi:protein-S-isoprenylcysteine O-methyltransferase Ste14